MPPAARSPATPTVAALLKTLPPERSRELRRVRSVIRKHLPAGYQEQVRRGAIVYEVPLSRYPDTYNGHPLWLAALAAPRTTLTLHLMPVYGSPELLHRLTEGFRRAGKRLDMGKACIHFQQAEDLPLPVIGEIIAAMPMTRWIEIARAARRR